jgi:TetR/AcrR family transcriptional repressor of nem operon
MVQLHAAMAGRPREFDADEALREAMALFWERGYRATSVDDLVEKLGIQRGSLYGAFKDKRTLFTKALTCYGEQVARLMIEIVNAPGPAKPNLRRLIDRWEELALTRWRRQGCLIVNSITELAVHEPEVAAFAGEIVGRAEVLFRKAIERAQAEGDVRPDVPARRLARSLMATMQGLIVMAKSGAPAAVIKDVVEGAKATLD